MGREALGVFNQVLAVFIVGGQLAVGGVHQSVLRAVAQTEDPAERREAFSAALPLCLGFGLALAALVWLLKGVIAGLLDSPMVEDGLRYVAPALLLFSVNKTIMAAINGQARLRLFAGLQIIRYVGMFATIAYVVGIGRVEMLPAALLGGELLVFIAGIASIWPLVDLRIAAQAVEWRRKHLHFGFRGLLSGVFLELNTRVDVLVIGLFLSDTAVGQYSLASTFAEGLYQTLVVAKNVFSPKVGKLVAGCEYGALRSMARRSWRMLYTGTVVLAALIALFLYGVGAFAPDFGVDATVTMTFLILASGVCAVSGTVPFDSVLIHSGHPGWFTAQAVLILATNVALNFLLVPTLGILGAAVATALALLASVAYFSLIMKRCLGFSFFGEISS